MSTGGDIPLMAYADVRPLIKSGDLLLTSGSSAMSKMIQAATESVFSHVAFLLYAENIERWLVIESVESIGVRAVTLSSYLYDYSGTGQPYPGRLYLARHAQFAALAEDRLKYLSQTAIDFLGYKYDQAQILSIALRIVAAKIGLPPRAIHDSKSFICSELVYTVYQSVGIDVEYNADNFIAPADFARSPQVTIFCELEGPASPSAS